jgi:transposase
MDKFIEGLSKIISVSTPWKIKEITVSQPAKAVNVFIDYETGTKFPCSQCNKLSFVHDSSYRVWRHLDLCDYRCYLNIKIPRTNCPEHGVRVIKEHPFGRQGSHYSYKFEKLIMNKVREMSMSAISAEIGEPDNNLWRVFRYYINKWKLQIDCSETYKICVDEKAYQKGHKYVTVFSDLSTGNVIYACEGRDESTFAQFYEKLFDLTGDPNYIRQICMDMSKSYIAGQKEYFTSAKLLFDKFHIKKSLNDSVNKVRKHEVLTNENLKKTKYIWLKNECNLTEKQSEKLKDFLNDATTNTAKAYISRLEFDQLWNVQNNAVEPLLNNWMERASNLFLSPINTFVNTIKNHFNGVVNAMKSLDTNAVAEGLNSLFQLAKARARGFRNIDNFVNMIYFLGNHFKFVFH